eukprot:118440-Amphidinium_carterae.1
MPATIASTQVSCFGYKALKVWMQFGTWVMFGENFRNVTVLCSTTESSPKELGISERWAIVLVE